MKTQVFFDTITNQIVEALKTGTPPWRKSWSGLGLPSNALSRQAYSGVNLFSLWSKESTTNYWLTYKQALSLGGNIKAGSKGRPVIYAGKTKKTNDEGDDVSFHFLKVYYVFNIDQTENIDWNHLIQAQHINPDTRDAATDRAIQKTGARIVEGLGEPCYFPAEDAIRMPRFSYFESKQQFYATLFHELGHWTGHASRLNRDLKNRFGSQAYAAEELVAEFASAFMAAHYGYVAPEIRHASYIESWIKLLRDNNRAILTASSAASKAANFVFKAAQ